MTEVKKVELAVENANAIVDLFNSKVENPAKGVLVQTVSPFMYGYCPEEKYELVHKFYGVKETTETRKITEGVGLDEDGESIDKETVVTEVKLNVFGHNTETGKNILMGLFGYDWKSHRALVDKGRCIEEVDAAGSPVRAGCCVDFRPAARIEVEKAVIERIVDGLEESFGEVLAILPCSEAFERQVVEGVKKAGILEEPGSKKHLFCQTMEFSNGSKLNFRPLSNDRHTARAFDLVVIAATRHEVDSLWGNLISELEKEGTPHKVFILPEFEEVGV